MHLIEEAAFFGLKCGSVKTMLVSILNARLGATFAFAAVFDNLARTLVFGGFFQEG
jgi:hypothetical protein